MGIRWVCDRCGKETPIHKSTPTVVTIEQITSLNHPIRIEVCIACGKKLDRLVAEFCKGKAP